MDTGETKIPENTGNATRYGRSADADATLAGDRAAIYHRVTRSAITLNPTGTILWQAMSTPRTVDELIDILLAKWSELDKATAEQDVGLFLEQLKLHNLTEITS